MLSSSDVLADDEIASEAGAKRCSHTTSFVSRSRTPSAERFTASNRVGACASYRACRVAGSHRLRAECKLAPPVTPVSLMCTCCRCTSSIVAVYWTVTAHPQPLHKPLAEASHASVPAHCCSIRHTTELLHSNPFGRVWRCSAASPTALSCLTSLRRRRRRCLFGCTTPPCAGVQVM